MFTVSQNWWKPEKLRLQIENDSFWRSDQFRPSYWWTPYSQTFFLVSPVNHLRQMASSLFKATIKRAMKTSNCNIAAQRSEKAVTRLSNLSCNKTVLLKVVWIPTFNWIKSRWSHAIYWSYVISCRQVYLGPVKRETCATTFRNLQHPDLSNSFCSNFATQIERLVARFTPTLCVATHE